MQIGSPQAMAPQPGVMPAVSQLVPNTANSGDPQFTLFPVGPWNQFQPSARVRQLMEISKRPKPTATRNFI